MTQSEVTLVMQLRGNEPSNKQRFIGEMVVVGILFFATKCLSIKESVEPESRSDLKAKRNWYHWYAIANAKAIAKCLNQRKR